jgi:hypothetical protein
MRLSRCHSLMIVAGSLLLSGCFRPWTNPGYGYGYGSPAYGGYQGYQGYGGYQGIQTLQPGQYYDPATGGTPTFAPGVNSLTPEPANDGGGRGAGDSGGSAPIYNPQGENPSRPVPDPSYDGDLQPPASEDGNIREQKLDLDRAPGGAQLQQVPQSWSNEAIAPAGHDQVAEEPAEIEAPVEMESPTQRMQAPALDNSVPLTDDSETEEGEPIEETPPLMPDAP